MKLEVGMYVRYENGEIEKIETLVEQKSNPLFPYTINCVSKLGFPIKASHNIIDLIEVGDYVNGVLIESLNDAIKPTPTPQYKNEHGEYVDYDENDIKTIVTKEQFESMSYKVGD